MSFLLCLPAARADQASRNNLSQTAGKAIMPNPLRCYWNSFCADGNKVGPGMIVLCGGRRGCGGARLHAARGGLTGALPAPTPQRGQRPYVARSRVGLCHPGPDVSCISLSLVAWPWQ